MSGDAEGAARAVLAERLSALRERSGRTYASLARRIGVSGSTLHRYCTGRTVPAEFAPVERLARLCGAAGRGAGGAAPAVDPGGPRTRRPAGDGGGKGEGGA